MLEEGPEPLKGRKFSTLAYSHSYKKYAKKGFEPLKGREYCTFAYPPQL
jgi:hypothetical protein